MDLDTIALNVSVRSLTWLRRRGLMRDEAPDTPDEPGSALDGCLAASLGIGDVTALPARREGGEPARPARSDTRSGQDRDFDVHAGVVVEAHDRLLALGAPLPYIPWAELLRRTYDVDALRCPCGGRLRFIAVILEAETAREILDALGLPSTPPPISRARSPDFTDPLPPDD